MPNGNTNRHHVTVIGAGLVGSLLSIYLARRGFKVDVYERRPDMRTVNIRAGRSINLALSRRGLHALEEVGLKERIMQIALPMKGRMVHEVSGEQRLVPYGQGEAEVINAVSRGELNKIIMDEAEKQDGVTLHFQQRCTNVDLAQGRLTLRDESAQKEATAGFTTVIGTDGAASAVRDALVATGEVQVTKEDLAHGYKELTIPPGAGGEFRLDKNALHIWPRGMYMLIALPNLDGSFTCTLFFPMHGEVSFATLQTEAAVSEFFNREFPDAVPMMPTLLHDFFANPTGALATIRCTSWHYRDRACILGDAAHAIVPFFGQGMNCGFEDCSVLNACIGTHAPDWQKTFAEFVKLRKVNTDAVAELSLANYVEMRDLVADPKFALKKEVEFALERTFPHLFIPKYSMVSFHRIPYSTALEKGKIQEQILQELCAPIATIEDVDWDMAEKLLKSRIDNR